MRRVGLSVKVLATLASVLGIVAFAASPAGAVSSFGTIYWSAHPHYGSGVGITAPSLTQPIANNNFVLSRAVVQTFTANPSNAALIQGGIYRSGALFQLDDCGTTGTIDYEFAEYHPLNSGTSGYRCVVHTVAAPGTTYNMTVYALSAGPGGIWRALVAGQEFAEANLGNITTAYAMMGGEIASNTSGSYHTQSNVTYTGAGNGTNWHYYTQPNLGGSTQVTNQANVTRLGGENGSDWTVGGVPTPLNVNHPLP